MKAIILSIIIPTHNRPQYLPRAVKSALQAAPDGNVEVIVVPNGGDETWRESLASLLNDTRIIVSPVEKGHANVARNHGLRLARGKYVRFLDDDDFLLDTAQDQLNFAIENQLEICSGYIRQYIEKKGFLDRVFMPKKLGGDFILASLESSGFTLPVGNLFLKECLDGITWDESIPRLQDNIWMLALSAEREWNWQHYNNDVGVWFHHTQERVSQAGGASRSSPWVAKMYFELLIYLEQKNRLSSERKEKIIHHLFQYAHHNFPNSPLYCHNLIKKTFKLYDDRILIKLWYRLFMEWIFLPYRYLKNKFRNVKQKYQKMPMLRKL